MASWEQATAFIKGNFQVGDESPSALRLLFGTSGGRTQVVEVRRQRTGDGQEWAIIASQVAVPSEADLEALLREAGTYVCGSLAINDGGMVELRHAVLLADVDPSELAIPLAMLPGTADRLEELTSPEDRH